MPDESVGAGTPGAGSQDAGTGSQGSTAASSSSGTTAVGAPNSGAGTPSGQPNASGANTGARQNFSYAEDRSNWVPPHRIRETTSRAQQLERELHIERSRVAALSGVRPPSAPEDPETAAIRQQFQKLYPGLAKLESMADKFERLADFDPSTVTAQTEHYWSSLGNQTLSQLDAKVKDVVGGDLTPRAQMFMHQAFITFVQSDRELQSRYAAQDPALLTEFLQEYQNGILDPYRRKVTTAQAPRNEAVRRMPRGGAGTSAIPGGTPNRIPVADTDEFHKSAWENFRAQQG